MDSSYKQYEPAAELVKAMAHPMRLCILNSLCNETSISVSNMTACLNVPQSTLSQQLAILRRAGLIVSEHHGKYVEYKLANQKIAKFLDKLLKEGLY